MTSISERALKITGLWGYWDFLVGFLSKILKNQNFPIFMNLDIEIKKNSFFKFLDTSKNIF